MFLSEQGRSRFFFRLFLPIYKRLQRILCKRKKQRIRKEHQEQMEYSKSQKEKTQKEITGVRQEIEEKRKAVLEEKEMLHPQNTEKLPKKTGS